MNELALPSNVEAERYVLGACMLSPRAVDDVSEVLKATDLHDTRHVTTYGAIRRLHDQDKPTDVVSVVDELIRAGELIGNLDAAYLHQLTDDVPSAANAGYWADLVREAAIRRHVIEGARRAAQVATDATVSASDVTELARDAFDQIEDAAARGVESIGDWFMDFAASLEEKPSYTPTPWYDLNQLIFGVRDGGMYVIAARPGDGKSIMAVQIGLALAKERPVLFVSLEMNREEIAARAIASLGQIFIGSLNKHQLTESDWKAFAAHRAALEALPLVIVDSSEVSTIPQLKAKARAVRRKYKRNPVVIVDYLQLLSSPVKAESRQVEVAGFSRALKLAAQQWKVPVLALSQLNRGNTQRKGKGAEPQLSDLRESGAIEQDADSVMLLHRRAVPGGPDELKVIVAKNRQGQQGEVTLIWQGQFSRVLSKYEAREDLMPERGRHS